MGLGYHQVVAGTARVRSGLFPSSTPYLKTRYSGLSGRSVTSLMRDWEERENTRMVYKGGSDLGGVVRLWLGCGQVVVLLWLGCGQA